MSRGLLSDHPLSDRERIAHALTGLYDVYTPEGVGIWLKGAKTSLGGVSPIQALLDGRVNDFEAAVERLRSGAM